MKGLRGIRQLSRKEKLLLGVVVVPAVLLLVLWCCDELSSKSVDDRASWEEVQEAVAWVSLSREYAATERFIKSTGSSPLPRIAPETPHEQVMLRINARKCIAADLMRTLTRRQVSNMNRNRKISYSELTPQQKQLLIQLQRYESDDLDVSHADLEKAYILVQVWRRKDGSSNSQFEWQIPTRNGIGGYPESVDLITCSTGSIINN